VNLIGKYPNSPAKYIYLYKTPAPSRGCIERGRERIWVIFL
jgi:hypothetical protein